MEFVCHLQVNFVRNPCKLKIILDPLVIDSKGSNMFPDIGDPFYLARGLLKILYKIAINRNRREDLDLANDGQVFKTCFFTYPIFLCQIQFLWFQLQKKINNEWFLNEWSTTKLCLSKKRLMFAPPPQVNNIIIHLVIEVPHWSIIDAGVQKVLTQSQLFRGLDDGPHSQILFAIV